MLSVTVTVYVPEGTFEMQDPETPFDHNKVVDKESPMNETQIPPVVSPKQEGCVI